MENEKMVKIVIDDLLPGLNDVISKSRAHWSKGAELKRDTTLLCRVAFMEQCPKAFKKKIFLKISWYEKNKQRNKDNISSAVKFIFDGMQDAGIIKNDGWKEIYNWENHYFVDKDNPRVEIEIMEV